VDYFTKFVVGAATVSFDALTTAQFIFNEVVCKLGVPVQVLSDQGRNFEAELFKQMLILIGSHKLRSSTYHAPGNGGTERVNKTIKPCLAKFVNILHNDWDTYLQMAISSYNNSKHATIGMSPYEALFGRPPVLVADIILNNDLPPNTKVRDISEFVAGIKKNALKLNEVLNERTAAAKEIQKTQYDKSMRAKTVYRLKDLVMLNNCRREPGLSKAFTEKFTGPYRIVKFIGDLNYVVESLSGVESTVHYNRMYPYNGRLDLSFESDEVVYRPETTVQPNLTNKSRLQAVEEEELYLTNNLPFIMLCRQERLRKEEESRRELFEQWQAREAELEAMRSARAGRAMDEAIDAVIPAGGLVIDNSLLHPQRSSIELALDRVISGIGVDPSLFDQMNVIIHEIRNSAGTNNWRRFFVEASTRAQRLQPLAIEYNVPAAVYNSPDTSLNLQLNDTTRVNNNNSFFVSSDESESEPEPEELTHSPIEMLNRPLPEQQELEYDSDGNMIPIRPPIRRSKRVLNMNAVNQALLGSQEDTFNDSEYADAQDVSTADIRYNDAGKETVECDICGLYFEKIYGLGVHRRKPCIRPANIDGVERL